MKIRKAVLEDIDILWELWNSVSEFQVDEEVVVFWPKSILIACIKDIESFILVAEFSWDIVWFIIVNYNSCFKKAIIENIFVKKEFRKKNIAKLLLETCVNNLVLAGCQYVCSFTEINNNISVNFYLKNWFNRWINCVWLDKILDISFKK